MAYVMKIKQLNLNKLNNSNIWNTEVVYYKYSTNTKKQESKEIQTPQTQKPVVYKSNRQIKTNKVNYTYHKLTKQRQLLGN